ncbi:MAG: hypothetical protein ACD_30C00054G0021 [uncultured bacterium]|uniref:peptidylprolyl isomerase n=4 Tax=Candidatus Daviesiibacteriota TaxID=1752718 RepID=A0A0G0EKJ4_9BACT|nr:MAG: hypothetical protein ACD_30C00054G0021 [uncultured bacterium]KKQ07573.1 MAG: Bacterial trigger factor like protein [Candidatus Daviesbacteria bacterium GW2011_GWB1_36_5]OGE16771.1 MAG: hypothetical protein A2858_04080 [Candidatus Daviesbacteria bacterium RIFCSPHIGHO2_01_FULL_36_37]OGE35282.1 MAG: hypothetical protein A3E66_00275 [Candidatus Daviesbacteria bacterium RIFCSPHIGHO2_12_FULL_37_16]
MPVKKKSTKRAAAKSTKVERAEESVSFLNLANIRSRFTKSGRTKWVILTLLLAALIIFLGNKYLIAAWVNNRPVTRLELNNALQNRYGKDVLEELIVERLIEEEARKRSLTVSQEELDNEIKKVEEQQGGAEQLAQILTAQNISRNDFNKLVRLQLLRQKMFGAGKDATDEEVEKYIEENKDSLALEQRTASEEAKFKESIKEQLKNQKVNQEFNTWLNGALSGPGVSRQI